MSILGSAYIFVLQEEHTLPGRPFLAVARQPGLDHQAGTHCGKEPADAMASCQLGRAPPGDEVIMKFWEMGRCREGS